MTIGKEDLQYAMACQTLWQFTLHFFLVVIVTAICMLICLKHSL